MNILIADDDRVISTLFSALLRTRGHQSSIAFDAMQTIMYAMRTPQPDLILLDINMPGGTGVEALRKLKISTKTAGIPVVVVSGTLDPEMEARVRGMGAEGFLRKPVQPEELFGAITDILSPSGPNT